MSEVVLFEVADDVALLTLNRPERLNAWTPAMQVRLFDLLSECESRPDVRVIVLTGAGRGFCAGADMQHLRELAGGTGEAAGGNGAGAGGAVDGVRQSATAADARPVTFPLTIRKPIIAAVNGACAGLGLVLALMCDLRIAAESAKLTTAFARRGLVAEHGISWILPRLVGPARALDLLLSARVVLGREAAELGLVNRTAPQEQVVEEALEYARMLAQHSSPASMAVMKQQVYGDLVRELDDALARANVLMGESFQAPDLAEGVASFIEQRPPRFAALR